MAKTTTNPVNEKISEALRAIKKQFGDESVMVMGEGGTKDVVTHHSGAYSLDLIL